MQPDTTAPTPNTPPSVDRPYGLLDFICNVRQVVEHLNDEYRRAEVMRVNPRVRRRWEANWPSGMVGFASDELRLTDAKLALANYSGAMPRDQIRARVEAVIDAITRWAAWRKNFPCSQSPEVVSNYDAEGHALDAALERTLQQVEGAMECGLSIGADTGDGAKAAAPAEPQQVVDDKTRGVDEAPNTSIERPSHEAIQAWRLRDLQGLKTQGAVAEAMTRELGRKIHQGTVSIWLRDVKAYLKAGNVLPDLPHLTEGPKSVDPAIIEMGKRRDARKPRPSDLQKANEAE